MSERKYVTHPHTWMMPMAYKPKIEKVRYGLITQTIRPNRAVQSGDYVLLFAWSGVPFRSKWAWQRKEIVTEVVPIKFYIGQDEIRVLDIATGFNSDGNRIARLDGINPPTGKELVNVLYNLYGREIWDMEFVAIRWDRGDVNE